MISCNSVGNGSEGSNDASNGSGESTLPSTSSTSGASTTQVTSSSSSGISTQPTGELSGNSGQSSSEVGSSEVNLSGTSSDTCSFFCNDVPGNECSIWLQDCPEGLKCSPYSHSDTFDASRCVEIDDQPVQLHEPCTTKEHQYSGLDNCDKGLLCWDTNPETLDGFCYAHCSGSVEQPLCPVPLNHCITPLGDVFNLCTLGCNPVGQTCTEGYRCDALGGFDNGFSCQQDMGLGQGKPLDACSQNSDCSKGLACVSSIFAEECLGDMCCLPFCDTNNNGVECPGNEQVCLPWFSDGEVPPSFLNIGVCGKNV